MSGLTFGILVFLKLAITMPIWFYLLHYLLRSVGAGELQMFLFWVYGPVHVIAAVIFEIVERKAK